MEWNKIWNKNLQKKRRKKERLQPEVFWINCPAPQEGEADNHPSCV